MDLAHRVAVQMYTLREDTRTGEGFREALRKCAEIGYPAVQLSAVGCMDGERPEVSPAQARAWLDEFGLRCVATHRPWERLSGKTHEEIEFHQALGCGYTALGWLMQDYQERKHEGYADWCRQAVELSARYAAAGIRLGYHNHAFEFEAVGGKPLYENFVEAGPALHLEVDTYWVHMGGQDPAALLRRVPGRVSVIHVKDASPEGEMRAVGEGVLDWDAILDAGKASGVEWYIVEQDVCDRDPYDCLASSFRFLSGC
jgi:sugar phosphate isomerase/epimerase